ncbi:MAG: 4-hydroxy-tetrahydrodipicolinate reductase [Chitinivibrionales bacterium]
MEPVSIIVNGICGHMGREIASCAEKNADTVLRGGIESKGSSDTGKTISEAVGIRNNNSIIVGSVSDIDMDSGVIIDFSVPEATIGLIRELERESEKDFAVVIGTTGFDAAQLKVIKEFSGKNPVLMSPNMSIGVNLLFHLASIAGKALYKNYDMEIIERHHNRKKDSPSGTAKKLGEILADVSGTDYNESVRHGRKGLSNGRESNEIGMHSVRGGGIVGEHTLLFAGGSESIELRHTAFNRAIFAEGAVSAAVWVSSKPPGLHTMQDLLQL